MLKTNLVPTALNSISQANKDLNDRLKVASAAFSNNEIYPHLQQLKKRRKDLVYLQECQSNIQTALDQGKDITALQPVKKLLSLEGVSETNVKDNIEDVFLFVQWALPVIEEKIEQGKDIHHVIENSLNYEWNNLFSADRCRGFIFINIASDSSDYVKIYYCRFDKSMQRPNYTGGSINLEQRKEVPPGEPRFVQKQVLNSRSNLMQQNYPNPTTVWITALENFPLQTLEQVAKYRFARRLIEEVRKKQQ